MNFIILMVDKANIYNIMVEMDVEKELGFCEKTYSV